MPQPHDLAMPRRLEIDDELFLKAEAHCPKYLSTTGFINLIIDQGLTGVAKVSAYHVGAGNHYGVEAKPPLQFPPDLEVTNSPALTEAVSAVQPKSWKPILLYAQLEKFEDLIFAFWRVKKGSKNEIAWKRLQNQLVKLLDVYGASVVEDQLELAINNKWHGVDFNKYEQFKPTGKNAPKRVERKLSPEEEAAKKEADHQAWLKSLNLS